MSLHHTALYVTTAIVEQDILPVGIASTLVVGNPTVEVEAPLEISPVGIASTLAVGTPSVVVGSSAPATFGISSDISDSIGISSNISDSIGIDSTT